MLPPESLDAALFYSRAQVYARCAFALQRDPNVAGAESLFDAALSNSLAVIVGSSWSGEEFRPKPGKDGKLKVLFSRELLDILASKARAQAVTPAGTALTAPQVRVDGIAAEWDVTGATATAVELTVTHFLDIPPEQLQPHRPEGPLGSAFRPFTPSHHIVRVDSAVLLDAIDIANGIRHGNDADGELEQRHLDALFALDAHPGLNRLLTAQIDATERDDIDADQLRVDLANDYLRLLTQDEIDRRVKAADWLAPDPFEDDGLQDCPLCGNCTLIPDGGSDSFGYNIRAGICFVCSYRRSREQAEQEAMSLRLDQLPD
ncbi:hypothetical protein [Kutzneria sp. CA-103260]|uniref:hypothetical protein n=1 Tax=Kutzneria sp. CA-103260 TaxID=2802641 RepID=UPI001BA4F67B|nr:hypothetical protein [Kutzneria sp. CA-103260]QUQ68296.1 hypothetical protein JJ691_60410 [Kutzneria sp. CA-103260]